RASSPQWTAAVFYDLLVPFIMPEYERVLYCDSDMVFTADPGELFEMPFEGHPAIAVRDSLKMSAEIAPDNVFIQNQLAFLAEYAGIRDLSDYFNTGVVMFSIPAIDKDLWLERIRTALSFPVLPTVDQDVLNYVLQGDVRFAPKRFNLQAQMLAHIHGGTLSEEAAAYLDASTCPVIIHYASIEKPWIYPDCMLNTRFWHYAERSPYYGEILWSGIRILREREKLNSAKYQLASVLSHIMPGALRKRAEHTREKHSRLYRLEKRLADCESLPMDESTVFFSLDSGIRSMTERTVGLSVPQGYTIAYTTDGRIPTAADNRNQSAVRIRRKRRGPGFLVRHAGWMTYPEFPSNTVHHDRSLPSALVVRAAAVHGDQTGPVQTRVYFPDLDYTALYPGCLILSIVVDTKDLLDHRTGILTPGALYDAWRKKPEAAEQIAGRQVWLFDTNITQRGKAWERPCLLQIYDGGASPAAELEAGIRVTGGSSRIEGQKSFNIYFRRKYGSRFLDYELFEGTPRYRSFRLRAGGNNTIYLKFKDAMLQELASGLCPGTARTRPAVLFLNGEYWGPYLLTEKITRWMLRDRYSLDADQIIIFKEEKLDAGRAEDVLLFQELMSFADKDMTDPAVWDAFCGIMDVRSLADYCAVRIYIGDADWQPDSNTILWRTRDRSFNNGKWQPLLFDTGYSSGMYRGSTNTAVDTDHFQLALRSHPLFASAMRNEEFRTLFLDALRKAGTECFGYEKAARTMDRYVAVWAPLMDDYYKRFGNTRWMWEESLTDTLDFFRRRYEFLLPLVEQYK
nr:CotH kinase family protein [Solobacterium sp.]